MKHTSINLSEEHAARISETGKSPTAIIREALDRYFNPAPSALELIAEHERRYHMPETAYRVRIGMRKNEHETLIEEEPISADMPEIAHKERYDTEGPPGPNWRS